MTMKRRYGAKTVRAEGTPGETDSRSSTTIPIVFVNRGLRGRQSPQGRDELLIWPRFYGS